MTKFNQTLDAPCPIISYTPTTAWTTAKQAQLPTSFVSLVLGAKAEWTFNGTGIWLYGSKEANHGFYNVTLDQRDTITLDGYASSGQYNTLLYGASNLKPGTHSINVVNAGPMNTANNRVWFSLDYALWETDIGGKNAQVSSKDFDDKDSRFQYLPDISYWVSSTSSNQSDGHFNHTVTRSDSSSAVAQFSFTGEAVAVYGALDPTHGNFVPTIDGRTLPELSTYYPTNIKQMMIFYADGLGQGSHVLKMQNKPTTDMFKTTSFDYATIWTGVGGTGPAPGGGGSSSNPGNKLSMGAIVGITTGSILLLIGAIIFLFFYLRRRRISKRPRNVLAEAEFTDFDGTYISPYIDDSPPQPTFQPQHGGAYAYESLPRHPHTPDALSWGSSSSAAGDALLPPHPSGSMSVYSGSATGSGSGSGSGSSGAYTYYAHNTNHTGPSRSEKRAMAYGYHVNEMGTYVPYTPQYASPTHRMDPAEVAEAEMEPLASVREEHVDENQLLPPHYRQAVQPWKGPLEGTGGIDESAGVAGVGTGMRLSERPVGDRLAGPGL